MSKLSCSKLFEIKLVLNKNCCTWYIIIKSLLFIFIFKKNGLKTFWYHKQYIKKFILVTVQSCKTFYSYSKWRSCLAWLNNFTNDMISNQFYRKKTKTVIFPYTDILVFND